MGFLDSLTLEKPDSYDLTDVLDYSPESLGSLYQQFESDENRGVGFKKTIRKDYDDFEGLGKGQVVISDDKEKGTVTRWVPYMGKEWVDKQNLKFQQAEAIMNAPLHLAPLLAPFYARSKPTNVVLQEGNIKRNVPITQGGKTFLQQKSSNKYKKQFMYVDELLNIADAKNVTPTPPPPRVPISSRTSSQIVRQHTQKAGFAGPEGEPLVRLDFTPTSIFHYDRTNVGGIGDLLKTKPNFIESLYPGNTAKRKGIRERIMSDSSDAIAYRELIDKHQAILANVKTTNINGREVKVSPLSEKELITDAAKLITLKENLNIPSPKVYENELGAFIKDGLVARITGGQASSNKPAAFQSKKGAQEREDREFRFTTEHDPHPDLFRDKQGSRRVQSRKAGAPEADHLNILETTMPWTVTRDKTGGFVPRSESQMKELTELMKREYNIDLGNVNENWMMASKEAHRTEEFAKHRTLASATDLQKPLLYEDADQVQLKLNDGRTIWARQDEKGKYYEGDVRIKPGQIESKGNLRFQGREYEPSQMHGASLKLQDTLAAITDTKQLAEAMKLFLIDSGAQEIMAGATTLSSYIYDSKKDLDPLTLKLRKENIPAMIKYIDTLLGLEQYENHKILIDLKESLVNRMKQNMRKFRKDIRERGA